FTMADSAWDAYNGLDKFKEKKVGVRTLAVFYPNRMQVVSSDGKGIDKFSDLKGKRVSTGAPASGTEVMSLRLIEAHGLDPNKDMTRERLSVAESVNALKDLHQLLLLLEERLGALVDQLLVGVLGNDQQVPHVDVCGLPALARVGVGEDAVLHVDRAVLLAHV